MTFSNIKRYNRQDKTIVSIYVNNNVKIHEAQLIELKNEIEKSTIRFGDFKTLL